MLPREAISTIFAATISYCFFILLKLADSLKKLQQTEYALNESQSQIDRADRNQPTALSRSAHSGITTEAPALAHMQSLSPDQSLAICKIDEKLSRQYSRVDGNGLPADMLSELEKDAGSSLQIQSKKQSVEDLTVQLIQRDEMILILRRSICEVEVVLAEEITKSDRWRCELTEAVVQLEEKKAIEQRLNEVEVALQVAQDFSDKREIELKQNLEEISTLRQQIIDRDVELALLRSDRDGLEKQIIIVTRELQAEKSESVMKDERLLVAECTIANVATKLPEMAKKLPFATEKTADTERYGKSQLFCVPLLE